MPQVRPWQQLEIETAADLPGFFGEITAAGAALAEPERRRLDTAADRAREAIADYAAWLQTTLADGTDDWALGGERYDKLVSLRAFDGLDAEAILEIGADQLEMQKAAGSGPRPRSTTTRPSRRSSTGSRTTTRRRSPRPSRPIGRRWSGRAST